jgi:hypothetical protein
MLRLLCPARACSSDEHTFVGLTHDPEAAVAIDHQGDEDWASLASSGMSMVNVVPRSGLLSMVTLPPWLSATFFTKDNPIPQPEGPPARSGAKSLRSLR